MYKNGDLVEWVDNDEYDWTFRGVVYDANEAGFWVHWKQENGWNADTWYPQNHREEVQLVNRLAIDWRVRDAQALE